MSHEAKNKLAAVKLSDLPQTMEVYAGIIANRCYRDTNFRERLKENAKETFRKEAVSFYRSLEKNNSTGDNDADNEMKKEEILTEIKDQELNVDIVICQNTNKKWYIAIPPVNRGSMSDSDLEQVCGGEFALLGFFGIGGGFIAASTATVAGLATTGVSIGVSGIVALTYAGIIGASVAAVIAVAGASAAVGIALAE